ncbi:NAD dependent epimerase/dehydratase [Boeremia exigua]|uniref:NAD dependent epimerase/dehydratase n=1 Tax=Boeremia exigua TaxID=749465 RepID=UPI001E8DD29B|nr:NAD dependent epimerase/dehydratase [Boeremia exigua]KAH6620565.1 NAD dependent epimerase/dehydratase [Boeremia exigua]
MPADLVFITGGTGFIGCHVIKEVLEAGHRARLSVRRESAIQDMKDLFPKHVDQLEFIVISDITKSDSFHSALNGVRYILHLASPIPGANSDFKRDYEEPAVRGTVAILEAAQQAPSVKRVVITSSANVFMPLDWVAQQLPEVTPGTSHDIDLNLESMAPPMHPMIMYHASKVLAHRACLDWANAYASLHFDIVTTHPALSIGKHLLQVPASSGSSNGVLWMSLFTQKVSFPILGVDVRDVALAHLRVLDAALQAGVNEFLLGSPEWSWEVVLDFIKREYPGLGVRVKGPLPDPIKPRSERTEELLKIQWTAVEDSVRELVDQQIELGQDLVLPSVEESATEQIYTY